MTDKTKNVFKTLFKKGDIILLIVLLVAVALTVYFSVKETTSDKAEIYIDGELKYSYNLNADKIIDLNEAGVDMRVVIKDGEIYVAYSNCSEQLCVHSAPVSSDGGMIVCLPNKVVIKVVSEEVDAVT